MSRDRRSSFAFAQASLSLLLLLLAAAAAVPRLFAQERWNDQGMEREQTWADSYLPLSYPVQNSGGYYRAGEFPSFDQLPTIRPLPDPFRFGNGFRDTSFRSWEHHRNDIMAAIEKYEIGPVPTCSTCTITANYVPPTSGQDTGTLMVNVTRNGKTLTLTSGVYIPQGRGSGPFATMIPMEIGSINFGGVNFNFPPPAPPDYGSLPAGVFQNEPIATVGYVSTQVAAYCAFGPCDHSQDPFFQLYPNFCAGTCSGGSNLGIYAAWTWGVDRLIDGMKLAAEQAVNPLPIDMSHLGVTGCSFAGKMALFAGAFDERIALTIAQESGGGGATSWRVSHDIEGQGTVEDVDDTSYDWFSDAMRQFGGANVYKMPVDQDELMGMVAPRALLETGNTEFYWLSNGSNYVAARAAQKIYNTLGIGDRFGFYIDGNHNHCATLPAEAPKIQAFVDKFLLGQSNTATDVEVYPNPADTTDYGYPIVTGNGNYAYYFPTMNYRRWTAWWGSNRPQFPDNWTTGGTVSASLKPAGGVHFDDGPAGPWGWPGDRWGDHDVGVNSGDTVKAGYELMLGGNHPAATVSLVSGANITVDVACRYGNSYTLTIPLPAQSYTIAAGDNSWQPSSDPASTLVYQGSAAAPTSGTTCIGGHVTNAYLSSMGGPTGGDGNPGGPGLLTTDVTDPLMVRFHVLDQNSGESTGYGQAVTIQWNPLTSSNSVNQNPAP